MSTIDGPARPKRRVRYRGRHPKKFDQKYKELNPEKFVEELEKIKSRGATPAGTHRPICVEEILKILGPQPGEIAVDATLGYGGHASKILPRLLPGGQLIGVDQDPIERKKTEVRLRALEIPEGALVIAPINFRDIRLFLAEQKISKVDMVLADLGVSSMQIDDPRRGFSFKIEAPLDLRMNPLEGVSAAELLKSLSEKDLAEILKKNSDEPYAELIAKAVIEARPNSTSELAMIIRRVILKLSARRQKEEGDSPIRRTFQALRIEVNNEFLALDQFLSDLPKILSPKGRVAILSFHSGEDRRVKKSFQYFERLKIYSQVAPELIRPKYEEQQSNPRSKSAKLRWARV